MATHRQSMRDSHWVGLQLHARLCRMVDLQFFFELGPLTTGSLAVYLCDCGCASRALFRLQSLRNIDLTIHCLPLRCISSCPLCFSWA